MRVRIATPTVWNISPTTGYRRYSVRPQKARTEAFSELFDSTTLAYDNIYLPNREELILLGPPLLNLKDNLSQMRVTAKPCGASCTFRICEMDRHMRLCVSVPKNTESVLIESVLGDVEIQLYSEHEDVFSGRRVLLTLSKDNPLDWICDWIRYHRDNHGADAVLLYDNGSRTYGVETIAERISNIAGVEAACVVRWNYKYGPQGFSGRYWDSDFCQSGSLEHARWRFLQNARAVLNLDIDELALTSTSSAFEIIEAVPSGYIPFPGLWVVDTRADSTLIEQASAAWGVHREFSCTLKPRFGLQQWRGRRIRPAILNRCPHKWGAVPSRHPDKAQWQAHRINGIEQNGSAGTLIEYRHFQAINTNWKHGRRVWEPYSVKRHRIDHELKESFTKVRWST
jgi:hypothetical protein